MKMIAVRTDKSPIPYDRRVIAYWCSVISDNINGWHEAMPRRRYPADEIAVWSIAGMGHTDRQPDMWIERPTHAADFVLSID